MARFPIDALIRSVFIHATKPYHLDIRPYCHAAEPYGFRSNVSYTLVGGGLPYLSRVDFYVLLKFIEG